jgi:hypothetical protein
LGYIVNEGDLLRIVGSVGHFSGLTQITPSAIDLLGTNQALVAPSVVSELNEDTESEFVSLGCVKLASPSQWSGEGSGFNVDVTDGENEWVVRIDADVDLFLSPAPLGNFLISGIGGQFDSSAPFDSGYQLLPRYSADLDDAFCPDDMVGDIEAFSLAGISLSPNPAFNEVNINAAFQIENIRLFNLMGQEKLSQSIGKNNVVLDVAHLSAGTYFILLNAAGKTYQSQLIKR